MRESKTLEFKEEISNSFLKTVSAYANYGTGQVMFGVADDGRTVGIKDLNETCLAIENKINDSVSPTPRECRHKIWSQSEMHLTCTAATKESSLLA